MERHSKRTVGCSQRLLIVGGIAGVSLAVVTPLARGGANTYPGTEASSADARDRGHVSTWMAEGDGAGATPRPRLVVRVRARTELPRGLVQETPRAGSSTTEQPVADRGNAGEARSGIHLFPPPGTRPPHRGIIVPDDFELPPGYVRHYQTTDDGKALPPVLMFHPDYDVVDEFGNPLPVPDNRVVPPDMAPPGLPIEILDVPPIAGPTRSAKVRKQLPGEEP